MKLYSLKKQVGIDSLEGEDEDGGEEYQKNIFSEKFQQQQNIREDISNSNRTKTEKLTTQESNKYYLWVKYRQLTSSHQIAFHYSREDALKTGQFESHPFYLVISLC